MNVSNPGLSPCTGSDLVGMDLASGRRRAVVSVYEGARTPRAEPMSPFHEFELLHEGRVVRLRRSRKKFENALEIRKERLLLSARLDELGRAGRGLLIDTRFAPPSTDADLEAEFRRFRDEVARGFDRVAALVRTKVGILQVTRLSAEQSVVVQPFDDEGAAMTFLLRDARVSS